MDRIGRVLNAAASAARAELGDAARGTLARFLAENPPPGDAPPGEPPPAGARMRPFGQGAAAPRRFGAMQPGTAQPGVVQSGAAQPGVNQSGARRFATSATPSAGAPQRFAAPPHAGAQDRGSGQRAFVTAPVARSILAALAALPRSGRAGLEHAIGQVEGMARFFSAPPAEEQAGRTLLAELRGLLREAPPARPAPRPGHAPIDGATAHAILDAIAAAPGRTRPELDLLSGQLASFLERHELPPPLRARGERLLARMEQGLGTLPMTAAEAAQAARLDAAVFDPSGSSAPAAGRPGPAPGETVAQAASLARRPILHPQLRAAALRAEAFLRVGADGALRSVWDRPLEWSDRPEVAAAILHQTHHALAQLALGHPPTAEIVGQMFGNDPGRLRQFAHELSQRVPPGTELHRLALHVRDTATSPPGRPGILVPPLQPAGIRPRFRSPVPMEEWRRRFQRASHMSGVRL